MQKDISTNCEIHTFDFGNYAQGAKEAGGNIQYHQVGVGIDKPPKFKSINTLVKELGHENRVIDIFKIDCEGCEWSGYKDWLSADIRQLLIETHDLHANTLDFFDDLIDAGFNIVSREPNILPFVTKNNNMALEWSLLRLDPAFSGGRTKRLN